LSGDVGEILDRTKIEVIYNCNREIADGRVKITMNIEPDHCSPIELAWYKDCNMQGI